MTVFSRVIPPSDERSPQENAAIILRAQLDARELLAKAEREQQRGAVGVILTLEDVRRIASNVLAVADLKEREHVDLYGGRRG